jgi:hypothetical protein
MKIRRASVVGKCWHLKHCVIRLFLYTCEEYLGRHKVEDEVECLQMNSYVSVLPHTVMEDLFENT